MNNVLLTDLLHRLEGRYSRDSVAMSMGDWICQNTTLRGRPFSFDRYPFQKRIADDMHPNMDVIKPSQVGLALALDTPVPTPSGWTTMGDLQVGDVVFDEAGVPTEVTYVSPIYIDHDCYEIEFDTGEVIVADANHRWFVQCDKAFDEERLCSQTGRLPNDSDWRREGVVRTEMLARNYKRGNRNLFAIPNTQPLQTPEVDLPIDPYVLGLWLGDGSSASATLTGHPDDLNEIEPVLFSKGYELKDRKGYTTALAVKGQRKRHRLHDYDDETATLYARLDQLELIGNKHIPAIYLRAAPEQRLELLRGLMDTDGSITKKGRASFHNCNPVLVAGVEELACSLGFKTRTRWRIPSSGTRKDGHRITGRKKIAEVSFVAYAEQAPFHLPRKRARVPEDGRRTESLRRRIVRVEKVASVPVRCISVNSHSHLFLAGRGMVPTHNTEIQVRKALAFLARNRNTSLIFTMPDEDMFNRMSATRILPLVQAEPVFNLETANGEKQIRSRALIQIGTSFMYVTGSSEGDATSISADAVFNDEVDLTDQKMLVLFNSRLQNSDWKLNHRFSTPTFVKFGIDQGYLNSDQHEYMCRCDSCGHWNVPIFSRRFVEIPGLPDEIEKLDEIDQILVNSGQIDLSNSHFCCEKCRAPLDLGRPENREWVPRYPSRDHHRGYRVRPSSTDRLPVSYIIQQLLRYKERDYLRGWYNTVLGEAYTGGNARLDDAQIEACMTSEAVPPVANPLLPAWIGIDVGMTCHIVVSEGWSVLDQRTLLFETCPVELLRERVAELLKIYRILGGGVDRFPYTPEADALHELSGARIVPIEYRGLKALKEERDELDIIQHASFNRTQILDRVARAVREKRIAFRGYGMQKAVLMEHLKDMVRDEQPEKPATWVKLNGQDHYFHALAFMYAAIQLNEHMRGGPLSNLSTVSVDGVDMAGYSSSLYGIKPTGVMLSR